MEYGQAIEITTVLSNQETSPVCQDWMVADAVLRNQSPVRRGKKVPW